MSSPITFSGFNNIDFNSVLEALSAQERQPVVQLETQQAQLQKQRTAFGTLATRLGAVESAARDPGLGHRLHRHHGDQFERRRRQGVAPATARPPAATRWSSARWPGAGHDDQRHHARRRHDDRRQRRLADHRRRRRSPSPATSRCTGLAEAINDTADIGVTASVVRSGAPYQLVLTGKETGAAAAFAVSNGLTGGSGVSFSATNAQDGAGRRVHHQQRPGQQQLRTRSRAPSPACTLTLQQESADAGDDHDHRGPVVGGGTRQEVHERLQRPGVVPRHAGQGLRQQGTRQHRRRSARAPAAQHAESRRRRRSRPPATPSRRSAQVGLTLQPHRPARVPRRRPAVGAGHRSQRRSSRCSRAARALRRRVRQGQGRHQQLHVERRADSRPRRRGSTDQLSKIGDRIDELERRLAIRKEAMQKEFIAADLAIAQLNASKSQLEFLQLVDQRFLTHGPIAQCRPFWRTPHRSARTPPCTTRVPRPTCRRRSSPVRRSNSSSCSTTARSSSSGRLARRWLAATWSPSATRCRAGWPSCRNCRTC